MSKSEPAEKKNIFQIIEDQSAVAAALEAIADNPDSDEAKAILKQVADECAGAEKDKIDAYAGLVRAYQAKQKIAEAEAKCYKDEIDRLKGIAKAFENKADSLKDMLHEAMKLKGVSCLESDTNKFRLMDASSEKLIIDEDLFDLDAVPKQFKVVVEKLDEAAVRAHLAMGGELTWATLERSQYIRLF